MLSFLASFYEEKRLYHRQVPRTWSPRALTHLAMGQKDATLGDQLDGSIFPFISNRVF